MKRVHGVRDVNTIHEVKSLAIEIGASYSALTDLLLSPGQSRLRTATG